MDETTAWLLQSRADLRAAEKLSTTANAEDRCHALAKCQQSVEKAIKAIIAALNEFGVLDEGPRRDHAVTPYMRTLTRLPREQIGPAIQSHLRGLLDQHTRADILTIDGLVPRRRGGRNTEYPNQLGTGWTYPAAADSFRPEEVTRFRSLGHRLVQGAYKLIAALRRSP